MDSVVQRIIIVVLVMGVVFVVPEKSQAQVTDGIAAVVNDKVITFSQIRQEADPLEKQYRSIYQGTELVEKVKEVRLSTLNAFIEKELIIQEFNEKGYFIPENVIEERVRKVIKTRHNGDRNTFIKTLQANGQSLSAFKEVVRNQTIIQAMRGRNVSSVVIVSPYQIEQFYQENVRQFVQPDEVKARVIYMKRGLFKEKRKNKDGEEVEVDPQRLIMEEILKKIVTGSDFASLAQGYSEGPQRLKGGDMGWVSKSVLRPELSKVAFKLRPGQNSKIIETDDGYYILLVEDLRKATVIPLAEVRERIESTLLQQERERLQQEWIDGLRSKAFIKMFF